ncbi:MAG TPA: hypothetical protein VGD26_00315, partial [Chitinophagaceae bacterium]
MRVETISRTLFQFDELSDKAKEVARDWYREGLYMDNFEFECVIEEAKTIAAMMGIEIDKVYWSGFSSQGDGACFEGSYAYKKGSVKAVKDHAPQDEKLHAIASALQEVQKKNFYKVAAKVKQVGRYNHSGCADIMAYNIDDGYKEVINEEELEDALRSF